MNNRESLIIWNRNGRLTMLAARCGACSGIGRFIEPAGQDADCEHCGGLGWFGIDPSQPVQALPGSTAKVAMLGIRYVTGKPLWHPQDGPPAEKTVSADAHDQLAASSNGNDRASQRQLLAADLVS